MKQGDAFQARRKRTGELVTVKGQPAIFIYESFNREPATMPNTDGSELINEWIACTWAGHHRLLFTRMFDFEAIEAK